MKKLILGFLLAFSSFPLFAADSYFCIAEQSAGFQFNKATKKWSSTTFAEERKFILNKGKMKGTAWELIEHGKKNVTSTCKNDFDENGFLSCRGWLTNFKMNNKTLRFRLDFLVGYVVEKYFDEKGLTEGDNTPYITIGTCTSL